jgi:hypothetical protein
VTEKTHVEDLSTEVAEAGRASNSLDNEATGAEAAGTGAEAAGIGAKAIGAEAEATGANVSAGREGIRGNFTLVVTTHIFQFLSLSFFLFLFNLFCRSQPQEIIQSCPQQNSSCQQFR